MGHQAGLTVLGAIRQIKGPDPCEAKVEAHLWNRGGFSIKCPTRGMTAIMHMGDATWDDVEGLVKELCSHCRKKRGLAEASAQVGPRV